MKKTLRILLVLALFCFASEIIAQAATLPESGKKIIEKYLNKKLLPLSIDYRIGTNGEHGYYLGGIYSSNIYYNRNASTIDSYMSSKGLVRETQEPFGIQGTINFGKYKIKSIDKVKMQKNGEYTIYRVAFSYHPMIVLDKPIKNKFTYKGFSNLVYDRFKEQWIIREDMGRTWSVAGNETYDLIEIDVDHFNDVFGLALSTIIDDDEKTVEKRQYHITVKSNIDDKLNDLNFKIGQMIALPDGRTIQVLEYAADVGLFIPGYSGPGLNIEIKEKNKSTESILLRDFPDYDAEKRGDLIIHYVK